MEDLSLMQHYLEYLTSPPVLLTILIIVGPFVLEAVNRRALAPQPAKFTVPGCFRLGLTKRSNLHDQFKRQNGDPGRVSTSRKPRIKALFTFPVKSCRGVELAASEIGAAGLKYDRLFTFAQPDPPKNKSDADATSIEEKPNWRFITQREVPRLALLQTELWAPDPRKDNKKHLNGKNEKPNALSSKNQKHDAEEWVANGGCVIIRFEHKPSFNPFGLFTRTIAMQLPLVPTFARAKTKGYSIEALTIWKDSTTAVNMTKGLPPDIIDKLKQFLGVSKPLAIFRVDDANQRLVTRSLPKDGSFNDTFRVGFADAFPMHILSLASVQKVNSQQPEKGRGDLDARRFRANIYLTNTPAFEEDEWKRIIVGRCLKLQDSSKTNRKAVKEVDGEYHMACRTARCKLPNVHPDTGIKDVSEPYSTLARTRKVDKGAYPHPCLGMQMIPLFQQGILRVGDEIEVLERGEHVYEKMFA